MIGVGNLRIGVPAEIKDHEYRVAITPPGVDELTRAGHQVLIERGAGLGSAIPDAEYVAAGAKMLERAEEVWEEADLLLKVKEPIEAEYPLLRQDQVLFTYLHLAASKACTLALAAAGTTALAYETVQRPDGVLPLLYPMSEVAGRMAPQVGAHYLERSAGGRGVLMGGVSGAHDAVVVILGAGVSGMNAAAVAVGMGGRTIMLDRDIDKLRRLDRLYQGRLQTVASNSYEVESAVLAADLVIGAVLIPGAKAPKLVTNELVGRMKPGAVLVDIAVDQGGCFESTRPTTHSDPVFPVHDTTFYCVANMPGAVPRTSTYALTNVTLPYVLEIARVGVVEAVRRDPTLAGGVNVARGHVTYAAIAQAHGLDYLPWQQALAA